MIKLCFLNRIIQWSSSWNVINNIKSPHFILPEVSNNNFQQTGPAWTDNMIVLKSFTADLPADFTGGIVNIDRARATVIQPKMTCVTRVQKNGHDMGIVHAYCLCEISDWPLNLVWISTLLLHISRPFVNFPKLPRRGMNFPPQRRWKTYAEPRMSLHHSTMAATVKLGWT